MTQQPRAIRYEEKDGQIQPQAPFARRPTRGVDQPSVGSLQMALGSGCPSSIPAEWAPAQSWSPGAAPTDVGLPSPRALSAAVTGAPAQGSLPLGVWPDLSLLTVPVLRQERRRCMRRKRSAFLTAKRKPPVWGHAAVVSRTPVSGELIFLCVAVCLQLPDSLRSGDSHGEARGSVPSSCRGGGTHNHSEMGPFGWRAHSSISSINQASLGKQGFLNHEHLRSQPREKMDPAGQRARPKTDPVLGSRGLGDRARLETDPVLGLRELGDRAWSKTDPVLGLTESGDRDRLEADPVHARHFGSRVSRQRVPPRSPGPESQLGRSAAARLWTSRLCLDVSLLTCGGGDGVSRAAQGRRGHSNSKRARS